jgi:hypothetical protein
VAGFDQLRTIHLSSLQRFKELLNSRGYWKDRMGNATRRELRHEGRRSYEHATNRRMRLGEYQKQFVAAPWRELIIADDGVRTLRSNPSDPFLKAGGEAHTASTETEQTCNPSKMILMFTDKKDVQLAFHPPSPS